VKNTKYLGGIAATILAIAGVGCDPGELGSTGTSGDPTGSGGGEIAGPSGAGGDLGAGASGAGASGAGASGPGGNGGSNASSSSSSGSSTTGVGGSPGSTGSGQGMAVPGVEVTLKSGEKVTGQLIAEYDHSIWWTNPTNETTLGIFDAAKFGEYPDDHSFRFLSSKDIVSVDDVTLPEGTVVYKDMLRDEGMFYGQVPAGGTPLYVAGGNGGYHAEENGNGDFAWDIVRAGAGGKSFTGTGKMNSDYLIWDTPLTLPIGGEVIQVIRDEPDNVPGEFGMNVEQNMIGVHIGGQFYLFMLHMRQGSIPASVQTGAMLPAGSPVGTVGNSGASIEPHLHIALVWYDTVTQRSWGVPSEWANVWTSTTGPSGPSQKHDYLVPEAGTWMSSSMF